MMAIARSHRRTKYYALAPALVFLVAFSIFPLVSLIMQSFHTVTWAGGQGTTRFVGLENYARIPKDNLFSAGIRNTAVLVFFASTIQVVLGLGLALVCSALGRQSRFYRTILLLPILIPGIVIGAIWKLMLNAKFGIINSTLTTIGLPPVDWLGSADWALVSVIIVDIWHWTPFAFLLLLAAIESLPNDLTEAARIDGASRWQEFRRITLPLLLPAIAVTFAFRAIIAFKVFDQVFLLTGGGPGTATEVISFTIYQRYFLQDDPGYGAAIASMVIFAVVMVIVVILTRRRATTA
jgi:multiple sugar transport system permease protein